MPILGVDTGGTFTDFVLIDGPGVRVHKVLSTPEAPERAILQGIRELGLATEELSVVHGSTVATNAALEGKGVRTVFITNRGFEDLLTIARQNRSQLYALEPEPLPPPVPRELCLGSVGRIAANGELIEPLDDDDLGRLVEQVKERKPKAVAINLLFSFLDDRLERRIEAALPDHLFISRSSDVLPEYREYERGITTWLNAWVGPLVQGYLRRLADGIRGARLAVMQSAGGTMAAEQAGHHAVHMLLSGPAGGLSGAAFVAAASERKRLLTFDMGGTSTDVALIDGAIRLTSEARIGPWPVGVPMVDMHTIGAGGGSIAWIDDGGLLQVGPQSAGADPGPACYGRGAEQPTVTDANLILGRLHAKAFLGGEMELHPDSARAAVGRLAQALGLDMESAAEGIVRLANEHMAAALRVISVQRGVDPREFALVSFGGAGGLHVCALADAMGMRNALVPIHAGVLSALGMLVAPRERRLARTHAGELDRLEPAAIAHLFEDLASQGEQALREEVSDPGLVQREFSVDLRYRGQSYTLTVPWTDAAATKERFHKEHRRRYGHQLSLPVELVTQRVAVRLPAHALNLPERAPDESVSPLAHTQLHGLPDPAPVYERDRLGAGARLAGPCLITERVATTYLAPGWECRVDTTGNLLLTRHGKDRSLETTTG
ncbi:MAG: hydantoinase/oxoprolinase family protein [Chromatiales bacterium]|nr:hydantoinase/oxoprolinase family protein [Chromatiales bacterium]